MRIKIAGAARGRVFCRAPSETSGASHTRSLTINRRKVTLGVGRRIYGGTSRTRALGLPLAM
jgi:hypothetical protein